jgi:S1-C subfamily serine protease
MSEIDRRILGQLGQTSRPDCPTTRALGDFLDQSIDAERKLPLLHSAAFVSDDRQTDFRSIEMHLRSCPACINRLIELRELARLQHHGPEPSAALLQEVISMVRAETSSTSTAEPSLHGRLVSMFGSIRSFTTDFRVVLGVAGTAVAALLALVLVHSSGVGSQPGKSSGELAQEGVGAFAERAFAKRIVPVIAPVSASSQALNARVLSALESLPKTLILEQTRGAVDTAVYKEAAPGTVLIVTDTALGSGILINSTGEILTNYHVIHGAKRVAVVFKPERGVEVRKDLAYAAIPIKVDETSDLAMLKVEAPSPLLHPLSMGDTSKLEVGDDVHAIGHPDGEVWTYTTGTISQIRPKYKWKDENIAHSATVIQTQTAINPGNSGGPLLNNKAQVIGINSFRMEGEGLNYAIAGDTIETFLKRPTNRVTEGPAKENDKVSRIERFGGNIAGAYMQSQNPPPDVWFVLQGDQEMPEYAVMGASTKDKLDTVFKGVDPKWRLTAYYYDTNCDGVVDLIGYSAAGSTKIDRYQRPETEIRLDSLAPDVARAFETGLIPYHQIKFCR